MRLARIIETALLASVICANRPLHAQEANPENAAHCGLEIDKAKYEGHVDGPFVTEVGYSKVLRSCVVIRVQGFPHRQNLILQRTDIFDTTAGVRVWEGSRKLPQGKTSESPYPALERQVKKLEIEFASREDK